MQRTSLTLDIEQMDEMPYQARAKLERKQLQSDVSGIKTEVSEIKELLHELTRTLAKQTEEDHAFRQEMKEELKEEIQGVRDEIHGVKDELKEEIQAEIKGVQSDLSGDIQFVFGKIQGVRDEIKGVETGLKAEIKGVKTTLVSIKVAQAAQEHRFAEIEDKIEDVGDKLKAEIQGVKTDLFKTRQGTSLRTEQQLRDLRQDLQCDMVQLKSDIAVKIDDVGKQYQRQVQRVVNNRAHTHSQLVHRVRANEENIAAIQRGNVAV